MACGGADAFVQRASEGEQVRSLKYHAEKKALAQLLMQNEGNAHGTLEMSINFGVCADCQHFLAHAAQALGRQIIVHEPHTDLVFPAAGERRERYCGRVAPTASARETAP